MAAEAAGILQWAIQGCLEWQRIGLDPPPEVREATNQYKFDMNVFDRWLDECCETGKGKLVRAGTAFKSHCNWAEQNGLPPLNNADFADKLLEHGFTKNRGNDGYRYLGLALL